MRSDDPPAPLALNTSVAIDEPWHVSSPHMTVSRSSSTESRMTMEDFSMADKHNASSNFSIPNRPIVRALENEFMRPSRLEPKLVPLKVSGRVGTSPAALQPASPPTCSRPPKHSHALKMQHFRGNTLRHSSPDGMQNDSMAAAAAALVGRIQSAGPSSPLSGLLLDLPLKETSVSGKHVTACSSMTSGHAMSRSLSDTSATGRDAMSLNASSSLGSSQPVMERSKSGNHKPHTAGGMKAESDRINSPRSPLSKSGRRPHASVGEPEGLDGYLMASLSRLGSSDRTETSSQPATRHEKPANRELLHSSAPRMMAVQDTHPMPPSAPQMTAVQYQNLSLSSGRRGRSDHDSMTATCAACDALIQVIEAADPGSPLSQISLDIPPSFHEETSVRLQGPEASSKPAVSIPGAYVESHSCSVPVAFSYAGSSDFSMRVPATVRSMRRNPSSDSLLSDASVLQQQRAQAHRGGDPALGHSAVSEAHISCERGREQSRATGMCGAESDASAAKADGLSPPATPPTGDQASTSSRPSSANEDAKELSVVQTIKLAHLKSMLADMEAAYCALSCTRQKGQLSEEIIRIKRELKLTATSHY